MHPKARNLMRKFHSGQQKACESRLEISYEKSAAQSMKSHKSKKRKGDRVHIANARQEGEITLIKISPPLPFSRIHSLIPAFASPPRHQPQTPDYLKQPCLGQWPKGMKSHKEISQRQKHLIRISPLVRMSHGSTLVRMSHGSTLNLPHSSTPPHYHLH
jgi:hypothetical protein